ncbi:MAG: hypothetical protein DHS20C02_07520 [Micavibrio sp.]|nr:MAG: hypothetical protein DHS20C02_07520 [Micavibrio sp.]
MMGFVVEVCSGRNSKKVVSHSFKDKEEIVIGRSYACDLIVDDPYVSKEHLKISKGNGFQIEDLNSKNGTRFKKNNFRDKSFSVQSGDKVHVGHTVIKIFSGDHVVQPAQKINWANYVREFLTQFFTAMFIFCAVSIVHVLNGWVFFMDLDYFKEQVYEDAMGIAVLVGFLGFIIYISSLLSKHTMKFTTALSYAGIFCIFIYIFDFLSKIIFASSLSLYFTMATTLALLSLTMASGILFLTYLENGKIAIKEWLTVAAIIIAVPFLGFYDHIFPDEAMKLKPHYESSMPVFAWEPNEAISIAHFLDASDVIFDGDAE